MIVVILSSLLLFIVLVIRNIIKSYVIYSLGDPTPKYRGLLTFNPLSHADPVGTTLLFLTSLMSGGKIVFGWTKYVDYDTSYFKYKDISELLVAFSGIGSFFIIVFLSKIIANAVPSLYITFQLLAYFSAFLLFLNLLPLKGFDGDIILKIILKKINRGIYYKLEDFQYRYQFLIIILFFFFIFSFSSYIYYFILLIMKLGGW